MGLPHYLAMTPEEFAGTTPLPEKLAWMSCRFSTEGPGLSQLPQQLPAGSILVLEDSVLPSGHNPALIVREMQPFLSDADGVLLDFQKPDNPETAAMAKALVQALPCPVGVSEQYAAGLECPIFLPPIPLHIPLEEYLAPYKGRDIWLDTASDPETVIVDPDGVRYEPSIRDKSGIIHKDASLHCQYRITISQQEIRFSLFRTQQDHTDFLAEAARLGVTKIFGLYQEVFRQ